jgi:hypothetical protein
MIHVIVLAHGALGDLDELLPVLIVGALFVAVVVVLFMTRRRDAGPAEPDQSTADSQPGTEPADHFRLN